MYSCGKITGSLAEAKSPSTFLQATSTRYGSSSLKLREANASKSRAAWLPPVFLPICRKRLSLTPAVHVKEAMDRTSLAGRAWLSQMKSKEINNTQIKQPTINKQGEPPMSRVEGVCFVEAGHRNLVFAGRHRVDPVLLNSSSKV